jgi:putative ABC transport system permease protein
MLLGLAARNLLRNLRRTLITSVAVVFGVALSILGWGLVDGLDENSLRASGTTIAGDVLLRPDTYPTDGSEYPLGLSTAVSPELAKALDARGKWTTRVFFSSKLVKGAESARVVGIGYDPAHEDDVFPRSSWTVDGAWPHAGVDQVAVGTGLARLLALSKGDSVVVEARTRAGAINALSYTVSGVVGTDNAALDSLGMWLPMDATTSLLQLEGERTHLALKLDHGTADEAAAALTGNGWFAQTNRQECADVIALNGIRRRALMVLVGVIMAIAATGIANTVVMSVYERVREIGTLLALGMRKAQIRSLFLLEGAVMGVSAGVLGAGLGVGAVVHWQRVGIALPTDTLQNVGSFPISATLFTHFSWQATLISFVFGIGVAIAASVWPARYAANLNPADAVRAD